MFLVGKGDSGSALSNSLQEMEETSISSKNKATSQTEDWDQI